MAWAVMCLSFASAADVWNFKSFTPADVDAVTGATTQWSSDDGAKSFKNTKTAAIKATITSQVLFSEKNEFP